MQRFLEEMYKTYWFDKIEENRADDIVTSTQVLKYVNGLKTIFPTLLFKTSLTSLYPALRYYSSKIKYPPFVLKYIIKSELNFPIEQLYTNDLNVVLLVSNTEYDLIDFFEINKQIKRYIFIDVLFTSKDPGYKTWYDAIQHVAIWDGQTSPILIEKPNCLKHHLCRLVDTTKKPLMTRVILSTLSTHHTVMKKITKLFGIDSYNERNASNCDKYFDTKDPYREVPLFHPIFYHDKAFINLRVEVFTTLSFQKQYHFYQNVLQTAFDLLRKEEKKFVDDFNSEKTLVCLKQAPLIKKKKDNFNTWEIKSEHNFIVRLLCEKNEIMFGKNSLRLEDNFQFKEKTSSIEDIYQNLLYLFEKIRSTLLAEKISFVE